MSYLNQVTYSLPNIDPNFNSHFIDYLSPCGQPDSSSITLNLLNPQYLPSTKFQFIDIDTPQVTFTLDSQDQITVELINTTGITKSNPHSYTHLPLPELIQRLLPIKLKTIDHTGFNLPYFDGLHPTITQLRQTLRDKSLYHTFPLHLASEDWDFIIPGTPAEISNSSKIDYTNTRQPKIEIVSFDKSSTPLIQIDLQLADTYAHLSTLFPEAIPLPDIKSLWVYLENPFDLDVCLVLNEYHATDWAHHFTNSRIT